MPEKKYQKGFLYLITLLWGLHCFLSLTYGSQMPWGGDEWYTYYDYIVVGTPNNFLVMLLKWILGPVTVDNFIIYRQVGLFWMFFVYLITFLLIRRDDLKLSVRQFLILNLIFITFSPFVFFQEQYFRYYGLFLFASFASNLIILMFNKSYQEKRWWFYALLLISPMIHYLLTWQLFFYILWKEWTLLNRKQRVVFGSLLLISWTVLFLNWTSFFRWFMRLGSSYSMYEGSIRGWNMATFIKPIVSVFQYLFGEDITALENWLVVSMFVVAIAMVLFGVLILFKNQQKETIADFSFASIIPFILMFYFLEPLTLPGATQLIAKHGLFMISWLILLSIPIVFHSIPAVKWGARLCFAGILLYACFLSLTIPKESWTEVIKTTSIETNKNTAVFVQGRSEDNFHFYAKNKIESNLIVNFYDTTKVSGFLKRFDTISVVLNDYRAYQILSKEQMWNTGTSSDRRFSRIHFLFTEIENHGFKADDSYAFFPLICFRFVKTQQKKLKIVPWFFNIKYQNLSLPVKLDNGQTLLGWKELMSPIDFEMSTNQFYYFIELAEPSVGKDILEITFSDGTSSKVSLSPENDVYRKFADRGIEGSEIVSEWKKRPLLSSSLAYPGSWLPAKGYIYSYRNARKITRIRCSEPSVSIHLFVQK